MGELSTNDKGAIAESAIRHAATLSRIGVYQPLSSHSRADLVLEIGPSLYRVQVKWGALSRSRDVINVNLSGSYCSPHGYVISHYGEHEIDLFAVYCGELDRCFFCPSNSAQIGGQFS